MFFVWFELLLLLLLLLLSTQSHFLLTYSICCFVFVLFSTFFASHSLVTSIRSLKFYYTQIKLFVTKISWKFFNHRSQFPSLWNEGERGREAKRARVWLNEWILFYFNMTKFICNMISIFIFIFFAVLSTACIVSLLACLLYDMSVCSNTNTPSIRVWVFIIFLFFVTSQTHLHLFCSPFISRTQFVLQTNFFSIFPKISTKSNGICFMICRK